MAACRQAGVVRGDAQGVQDAVGGDTGDVLPAPLPVNAAAVVVDGQPLRVANKTGGEIGGAANGIVAAQNAGGDGQPQQQAQPAVAGQAKKADALGS